MPLSDEDKRTIEDEERFRAEARTKSETSTKPKPGCFGWLIRVTVFVWVIVFFMMASGGIDSGDDFRCKNEDTMAFIMAKEFVEKQLKAPSTADFPTGTSDSVIRNIGGCSYEVISYVDAQNSFGAKLRNRYRAVVKYNKATNRWTSEQIDFLD